MSCSPLGLAGLGRQEQLLDLFCDLLRFLDHILLGGLFFGFSVRGLPGRGPCSGLIQRTGAALCGDPLTTLRPATKITQKD